MKETIFQLPRLQSHCHYVASVGRECYRQGIRFVVRVLPLVVKNNIVSLIVAFLEA